MVVVTLASDAFAAIVRSNDCVILPVAIGGYCYAVIRGAHDSDIYRVSVA